MQRRISHTFTVALTLLLTAPLMFVFQGMEELHKTSVGYHGNLKSTNVLVDSYWICKVADYGLQTFRESNLHRQETLQTLSGYQLVSFYFSGLKVTKNKWFRPAFLTRGQLYLVYLSFKWKCFALKKIKTKFKFLLTQLNWNSPLHPDTHTYFSFPFRS